jgi:hypothetical protein
MDTDDEPSQPASLPLLVATLVDTGRSATEDEARQIIDAMAAAPFTSRIVRVPPLVRTADPAKRVGSGADSLIVHLIKRIWVERQWSESTTADDFLVDIRAAIRHPTARLLAYRRSGQTFAATITQTSLVVPVTRQGMEAPHYPDMLVVYDVEADAVVTAYMFSTIENVRIPGDTRWLR